MSASVQSDKKKKAVRIENNIVIADEAPIWRECISVGKILLDKMRRYPDFVAQVDTASGKESTFGQMIKDSVKCALWMQRHGIGTGDIVGVCTHTHLNSYIPLLACLYIGAIFYPWHYKVDVRDARYPMSLASPKLVFVNENMVEIVVEAGKEERIEFDVVVFGSPDLGKISKSKGYRYRSLTTLKDILASDSDCTKDFDCTEISSPEQTAMILCSSGTTGRPKGAVLSHAAIMNHILYNDTYDAYDAYDDYDTETAEPKDIVLCFSSFRWISGTMFPLQAIYLRQKRIIPPKFHVDFVFEFVDKYQVTWLMLQASMITAVLKTGLLNKDRFPSLRRIVSGGAVIHPELLSATSRFLPHTELMFGYGSTEAMGIFSVGSQRRGCKLGSTGYLFKNFKLKVIDTESGKILGPNQMGELIVKSPCMMKEYYNDPKSTKESVDPEGWFHTADIGYFDEDGEIYVCDRLKHMIKYRGCFMFPGEIESVIHRHPGVLEAVVVPLPSEDDEYPLAFVSKIPGKEVTEEELCKLVADNLQDYKQLRGGVRFIEKIPLTQTGKINRKYLTELARTFVDPLAGYEVVLKN